MTDMTKAASQQILQRAAKRDRAQAIEADLRRHIADGVLTEAEAATEYARQTGKAWNWKV